MVRRLLGPASAGALVAVAACGSGDGAREAQSAQPLTVQIGSPLPTYAAGELEISVGEGVSVTFSVTPGDHVESVEVRAADPDALLGRLGHGPYAFWLSKSVPGEAGRRQVCALATDAAGSNGEACFWAVP